MFREKMTQLAENQKQKTILDLKRKRTIWKDSAITAHTPSAAGAFSRSFWLTRRPLLYDSLTK